MIEVRTGVMIDVREGVALSLPNKVAGCKLDDIIGAGILGRFCCFDFRITLQ